MSLSLWILTYDFVVFLKMKEIFVPHLNLGLIFSFALTSKIMKRWKWWYASFIPTPQELLHVFYSSLAFLPSWRICPNVLTDPGEAWNIPGKQPIKSGSANHCLYMRSKYSFLYATEILLLFLIDNFVTVLNWINWANYSKLAKERSPS